MYQNKKTGNPLDSFCASLGVYHGSMSTCM